MYGSGWVVSMVCRSMMAECIPRVPRVSASRFWCVNGGYKNGVGFWGLSSFGYLGVWVWMGMRVPWGVGMDFGSSSSIWG